ncbi:hypothetical protein N665_0138s0024 [Sinapis alba]|nr:hypothetical protein N665_0138s0024 [Sinapis alba]
MSKDSAAKKRLIAARQIGGIAKSHPQDLSSLLRKRYRVCPVRLVLPGELAKHAVSEGTKAVTKFTSS